jgi:hypothetical protein
MPWVRCTVERAGPADDGTIYIALRATDNSFNNWYSAGPAVKKEMLATALTAISLQKEVDAFISDVAPYSTINRLYVNR